MHGRLAGQSAPIAVIEPERIRCLNDAPRRRGRYVLYWMQQSQRAVGNAALDYAARCANELELPLLAVFGVDDGYPDANRRHYAFMLQGLAETTARLADAGIKTIAHVGAPGDVAAGLSGDAALVVCDRGYLRHQQQWRKQLARGVDRQVVQVEGDVVVPVELASDSREWAARTIRKKINRCLDGFISETAPVKVNKSSLPLHVTGDIDLRDWRTVLDRLDVDSSVAPVDRFAPGTTAAQKKLTAFLRQGLPGYANARNDPAAPQASELSPYLHFGQISPVEIARKVRRARGASSEDKTAFLEEVIVRRELACNYVYYTRHYDRFSALPDWARRTLEEHRQDERPVRYTRRELEQACTDDPYWNAAMREMLATGYMHNYMRMYWGKKILQWCNTPEYAYRTALYLNNKYFLDGRDPNSYANVAWLFGLHDRAWAEREIFGKVRYMSAGGLESKFDVDAYVRRVEAMTCAENR